MFYLTVQTALRASASLSTGRSAATSKIPKVIALLTFLLASHLYAADPFVHGLFSNNGILQRGKPVAVWGWTTAGAAVNVTVSGLSGQPAGAVTSTNVFADNTGRWLAYVGPFNAPGPCNISVSGPQSVTYTNIAIGDVWLMSGQSNMEMPVWGGPGWSATNGQAETAAANYPNIRLYKIPYHGASVPKKTIEASWQVCSPATVSNFSAIGYFTARELYTRYGIPQGVIQSAVGGTPIVDWMRKEELTQYTATWDMEGIQDVDAFSYYEQVGNTNQDYVADDWCSKNDPGTQANPKWYDPSIDDSSWTSMNFPGTIVNNGWPNNTGGIVWTRRSFSVPASWAGKSVVLCLGGLNQFATTYLNGQKVAGALGGWNTERQFIVPAGIVVSGNNLLSLRFFAYDGDCGFTGSFGELRVELAEDRTQTVSLNSNWRAKLSMSFPDPSHMPILVMGPTVTALYNGMIAPVQPFGLSGFAWYQGESGAGQWQDYDYRMPTLMADWRKGFGQGDLPFVIVSLANCGSGSGPVDTSSYWPETREAHFMASQRSPNAGLAVAIDVGDPNNIHPANKQAVGYRVATSLRHLTYGDTNVWSGPVYQSMSVNGNQITLTFNQVGTGLTSSNGTPHNFALGDGVNWVWGDASITSTNTIVVSSSSMPNPVAVRYGWDDYPEQGCNVYNNAGLPASPFRTDVPSSLTPTNPGPIVIDGTYNGLIATSTVSFRVSSNMGYTCSAKVNGNAMSAEGLWASVVNPGSYILTVTRTNEMYMSAVQTTSITFTITGVAAPMTNYVAVGNAGAAAPYTNWTTAAATIQDAVTVVADGGTVIVGNGTYIVGAPITVTKNATIRSLNGMNNTIIDGNNATQCVYLAATDATLDGFTIRHGAASLAPAAMVATGTIQNCMIVSNACSGAATLYGLPDTTIRNCIIRNNTVSSDGGGIYLDGGTVENCVITGNSAGNRGGGVYHRNGGRLVNCTLTGNTSASGGGLYLRNNCTVQNTILFGNASTNGTNYYIHSDVSAAGFSYCDSIPAFTNGSGNIVGDPLLDASNRLTSASACIDAGSLVGAPATDLDGVARWDEPNHANGASIVDIGAYEFLGSTNQPPPQTNAPSASYWTAYNDCAWTANSGWTPSANDITGNFTTNSPVASLSGALRDSMSGTQLAAQVSFNIVGASGVGFLDRNIPTPAGSDASAWFNGKVGTNCAANWTAGSVTMTLSGLDPTRRYQVVLLSSRGAEGAGYSNRFTDITLSSADAFLNLSSPGLDVFTTAATHDRTRVRSALGAGYVARYDQIAPGADGAVTLTITAGADAHWASAGQGSTNGYLNAFMVSTSDSTNDADGNGIADAWEIQNFGAAGQAPNADPDGDGLSNLQEYILDGNPRATTQKPEIIIGAGTNGNVSLDFSSLTQRIYTIDIKTSLTSGAWTTWTNLPGTGGELALTNLPPSSSSRFYRFRVRLP